MVGFILSSSLKEKTIRIYAAANANSRNSLRNWLAKLDRAEWHQPKDILQTFPFADLLGNGSNRVVFDIGGNSYRMICEYWFAGTRVHLYIKWHEGLMLNIRCCVLKTCSIRLKIIKNK